MPSARFTSSSCSPATAPASAIRLRSDLLHPGAQPRRLPARPQRPHRQGPDRIRRHPLPGPRVAAAPGRAGAAATRLARGLRRPRPHHPSTDSLLAPPGADLLARRQTPTPSYAGFGRSRPSGGSRRTIQMDGSGATSIHTHCRRSVDHDPAASDVLEWIRIAAVIGSVQRRRLTSWAGSNRSM